MDFTIRKVYYYYYPTSQHSFQPLPISDEVLQNQTCWSIKLITTNSYQGNCTELTLRLSIGKGLIRLTLRFTSEVNSTNLTLRLIILKGFIWLAILKGLINWTILKRFIRSTLNGLVRLGTYQVNFAERTCLVNYHIFSYTERTQWVNYTERT